MITFWLLIDFKRFLFIYLLMFWCLELIMSPRINCVVCCLVVKLLWQFLIITSSKCWTMMSFTGKIIMPSNWGIFVEWPFNDDWPIWFVFTEVTYFDLNIYDNVDNKISFRLGIEANVDSMTVIFWDIFMNMICFNELLFSLVVITWKWKMLKMQIVFGCVWVLWNVFSVLVSIDTSVSLYDLKNLVINVIHVCIFLKDENYEIDYRLMYKKC